MNFVARPEAESETAADKTAEQKAKVFALVGIVKNEARYLLEWLAFYECIGVRHFVIFDNESTDDTRMILESYADLVDIEIINWETQTGLSPQLTAYNYFLDNYREQFEFAAFFDSDEFLVPLDGTDFNLFLKEIPESVSAIGFNQRVFGSSSELRYRPNLVLERFRTCAEQQYGENKYIKSMYRLRDLNRVENVHLSSIVRGAYTFDDFSLLPINKQEPGTVSKIHFSRFQLNHYILKSREEYEHKQSRGGGTEITIEARKARYTEAYFSGREPFLNIATSVAAEHWIPKVIQKIETFQSHLTKLRCQDFALKYYRDSLLPPTVDKTKDLEVLRFDASDAAPFDGLNLSFPHISQIFLGTKDCEEPKVPPDSPGWAKSYIAREFKASEHHFRCLADKIEASVHPVTGKLTPLEYCFVSKTPIGMTLPVFKVFGNSKNRFCLVFAGLVSRVSHIILPDLHYIIYDLDRPISEPLWHAFQTHECAGKPMSRMQRRIGLIDMVTSYAHQAMNYLSGIQRLIDSNLCDFLDEIWVCGIEFFGPTRNIFPEMAGKIRHMSRQSAADVLSNSEHYIMKLGSNFITESLHRRLTDAYTRHMRRDTFAKARWPLLAITVRSSGRSCKNLPEVIEKIVSGLLWYYPNLGLVLDGWVLPEAELIDESHQVSPFAESYLSEVQSDAMLCHAISSKLPPDVVINNLIGFSLFKSLRALRDVDVYFAHAGTLQHKIAWFTGARGVVHGPQSELSRMESSYYSSEFGRPPIFVDSNQIVDVWDDPSSGARFHDYFILDTSNIVDTLRQLISANCPEAKLISESHV